MEDNGGPAFPSKQYGIFSPGMSLRDWFAGQALSKSMSDGIYTDSEGMKSVAEASYEMADAMLKARDK